MTLRHQWTDMLTTHLEDYRLDPVHVDLIGALTTVKEFIDKSYKRPENIYCHVKTLLRHPQYYFFGSDELKERALRLFSQTPQEKMKTMERAEKAVELKNMKVTELGVDDVLDRINMLRNSVSRDDRFVALQLACGLRQREILDKDKCEITACEEEGFAHAYVWQEGSAKKKDIDFGMNRLIIGMSAQDFVHDLAQFRGTYITRTNVAAQTTRMNRRLVSRTKELFQIDAGERSGTHFNRAIYAAMFSYLAPPTVSGPLAVKVALGHKHMKTAPHYMYIRIKPGRCLPVPTIEMETEDGKVVSVPIPPRRGTDFEAKVEDYKRTVAALTLLGVPRSAKNLDTLGFHYHFRVQLAS